MSGTAKTLLAELAQSMNEMERWQKSRKRFWVYGEARMHLLSRLPKRYKVEIIFEDGSHMIRGKGGRYLLNSGEMDFPLPRDLELEEMP